MIQELLKAFMLIFIAEMGDKTQILAMAFATRYPVRKVLFGIFIGSFLNHGLAVILGSYISNFIPINTIQIIAGLAFVGFALWTLKPDDEEDEADKAKSKFGPVLTVAIAFFIGELGDKTQLTAITLATDAIYPVAILGGTVLGMIATGGIGIFVGKKIGDKIPEFAIKIIAATVFMFFGVAKLYQTVPSAYMTPAFVSLFIGFIGISSLLLLMASLRQRKQHGESALSRRARELHEYYHKVGKCINNICLGTMTCGTCQGDQCIIGNTKNLIRNGLADSKMLQRETFAIRKETLEKHLDKGQALESLRLTLEFIRKNADSPELENIHRIRKNLEMILFGRSIEHISDWSDYARRLTDINESIAVSVLQETGEE